MQKLSINGQTHEVDVPDDMPLLWVLRDVLAMTGTKYGCGIAQCGVCTVHLDGRAVRACVLPVSAAVGHEIGTIEGVGASAIGQQVQAAWLQHEVVQCGYCQPGQIMAAVALLEEHPKADDEQIVTAMSGNLCRCATYTRIRAAIKSVSQA